LYVLKGTLAANSTKARRHFETAISLSPDYAEAYFNLGVLEWQTGNRQKAREAWEQAVRLKPELQATIQNLQNR
jgi:tetratricopeptide (TPR) repeat protein